MTLVSNGCKAVCEGANMPTSMEATKYLQESGVWFLPGKASNAGGVATSALEMSQNSQRLMWRSSKVDTRLQEIMVGIFHKCADAAERYGMPGNYIAGANIAGFEKVADAMIHQGICCFFSDKESESRSSRPGFLFPHFFLLPVVFVYGFKMLVVLPQFFCGLRPLRLVSMALGTEMFDRLR